MMNLARRARQYEAEQAKPMSRFDDDYSNGDYSYGKNARLIIIDPHNDDNEENWSTQLQSLPVRLIDMVTPEAGPACLDTVAAVDLVWAEIGTEPVAEALIARLQLLARHHVARIVWVAEGAALDQGYSAFGIDQEVTLLSAPSAAERASALMMGIAAQQLALHDNSNDRSQYLAEEVNRIARMLADLSGIAQPSYNSAQHAYSASTQSTFSPLQPSPATNERDAYGQGAHGHDGGPPIEPVTASEIRSMIRLRRMRDQFFAADLFADPAWDMLLDLMAARLSGEAVSVSSLCIASAVPATTALRWIRSMTDRGILVRQPDPQDGRRVFIALSTTSADAISRYFTAAKESGLRM